MVYDWRSGGFCLVVTVFRGFRLLQTAVCSGILTTETDGLHASGAPPPALGFPKVFSNGLEFFQQGSIERHAVDITVPVIAEQISTQFVR